MRRTEYRALWRACAAVLAAYLAAGLFFHLRKSFARGGGPPSEAGFPAGLPPLSAQQRADRGERLRAAGRMAKEGRDWDALAALQSLDKEAPGEPEVLLALADAWLRVNIRASARAALDRIDRGSLTAAQRSRVEALSGETAAR